MARNSLAPSFLIAMPQMLDPNFARTVVLLCREDEEGAMGLVVNRRTHTPIGTVVDLAPPSERDRGELVWLGGPVEPQRGWLLVGYDPHSPEAMRVTDDIFLSASMDVLRDVVEGKSSPGRFLLGYAGWGEGQLQSELAASAWLTTEIDYDILFHCPPEAMWERAIRSLGVDPYALQAGGGVH